MISAMDSMWAFYKQTWWLWLIFLIVFALLSYYVSPILLIMIPGLIGYSIYFGLVRISELREQQNKDRRRQRTPQP